MCGTLKHEHAASRLGSLLPAEGESGTFLGKWNGHAREESLSETFLKHDWKEGTLSATGYTEGHPGVEYSVPEGKAIKIIYYPGIESHPFNIVTRKSTPGEAKIHPRWPVLVDK